MTGDVVPPDVTVRGPGEPATVTVGGIHETARPAHEVYVSNFER